jgi:hypothetical protein
MYVVLPCSQSSGIHSKSSVLRRNAVLICSPVFSLIKALTVVLDREFGGRFLWRANMAGKLKPLEVERQITPGKYPDGFRFPQ